MFNEAQNEVMCLCCLHPSGGRLSICKNGTPMVRCRACGSISFLNTREALNGLKLLAPKLPALLKSWGHALGTAADNPAFDAQVTALAKAG